MNYCVSTILKNLFRAEAQLLFGCLKPRPEVRGNSDNKFDIRYGLL